MKIFIQINISKWTYLQNYLATNNTYVYGYLGTSGQNTQKYHIENLPTFGFALLSHNFENKIVINAKSIYKYTMDEIINQYNTMFWSQPQLSENDFVLNSTVPSKNKPWAIQIYNLDGKSKISNQNKQVLIFPQNYSVLRNNAIRIKINTINTNVAYQRVTNICYLNKFIYTNKNANKNHDVGVDSNKLAQENNLEINNVIDLTSLQPFDIPISRIDLSSQKTGSEVKNEINTNWNDTDKVNVSKRIVINLNNQLNQETQYLNQKHLLSIASENVTSATKNNFEINNLKLYKVDANDEVTKLNNNQALGSLGSKIYLQLNVSNWTYLNNYISAPNSYVYFYVGVVS